MKLLSVFLASSLAQYSDYSGYSSGYGYGNYGEVDPYADSYGKFTHLPSDGYHGNGLYCLKCHGRLRNAEIESTTVNAWSHCLAPTGIDNGASLMECHGDERVCMTEERRRYNVVVEVKAGCSNPESCLYQWRRNDHFMPLYHLFGDHSTSTTGEPGFFDDECQTHYQDPTHGEQKFANMKSQWESTCRHCCTAGIVNTLAGVCNGPLSNNSPLGHHCADDGTSVCTTSDTKFQHYSIKNIPLFMETFLSHNRAHPGEGRNSLPEDKFAVRTDAAGNTLQEQADRLSVEDTDFHNNRPDIDTAALGTDAVSPQFGSIA